MRHEIIRLNLENEMDLILVHKKSIRIGAALSLSISNQTSFTTAISECCREVLEKAGTGLLTADLVHGEDRFFIEATIQYRHSGIPGGRSEALEYARRLVDRVGVKTVDDLSLISLKVPIPRSARLNDQKIQTVVTSFRQGIPDTPYEEFKQKKEELNRIAAEQEEQLIRSHYINEKKTEFLSIASHELKTPLTTIKAFTQLALAEEDGCNENVKMYLSKINTQSDKLYKLIQQLLDVSKVETGQLDFTLEEVSMNNYIQETVSLISKSIPTHMVQLQLAEDVVAAIDRLRLEQVFSNILVNAAKYSKEKTKIHVSTTIPPNGGLLQISVRDEGIGMTEQNLRRVFEKFFRVEEIARSYSGLGMGLYIASRIVSGHGGKIWIESKVDTGSTFHFTVPYLRAV